MDEIPNTEEGVVARVSGELDLDEIKDIAEEVGEVILG